MIQPVTLTIRTTKVESHWNYFLALERDLDVLSRYVEFHDDNFKCFSLEIGRILLGAGAEVDVVCKLICRSRGVESDNILTHRTGVTAVFPDIPNFKVQLLKFGLVEKTPWQNWQEADKPPDWWSAHNKVKHERDEHYAKANLGHALNAVAGLFVVGPAPVPRQGAGGAAATQPTAPQRGRR